jgi:hypothetical protein
MLGSDPWDIESELNNFGRDCLYFTVGGCCGSKVLHNVFYIYAWSHLIAVFFCVKCCVFCWLLCFLCKQYSHSHTSIFLIIQWTNKWWILGWSDEIGSPIETWQLWLRRWRAFVLKPNTARARRDHVVRCLFQRVSVSLAAYGYVRLQHTVDEWPRSRRFAEHCRSSSVGGGWGPAARDYRERWEDEWRKPTWFFCREYIGLDSRVAVQSCCEYVLTSTVRCAYQTQFIALWRTRTSLLCIYFTWMTFWSADILRSPSFI